MENKISRFRRLSLLAWATVCLYLFIIFILMESHKISGKIVLVAALPALLVALLLLFHQMVTRGITFVLTTLAAIVAAITWLSVTSTDLLPLDIVGILFGILSAAVLIAACRSSDQSFFVALSELLRPTARRHSFPSAKVYAGYVSLSILCAWVFLSAMQALTYPYPKPLQPSRFETIGRSEWDGLRVGVALSGGGYRAALLHAGALKALERKGVRVTNLSTVSGGSIIGAFYALGGRPEDFLRSLKEGQFNLRRELLLIQNAFPLACPAHLPILKVNLLPFCEFSRLDVQKNLLDRVLLHHKSTADLHTSHQPSLIINTTDLISGAIVGFRNDYITVMEKAFRLNKEIRLTEELTLADLVAVSGSFPGAFPPKLVKYYLEEGDGEFLLADGGILDNLGIYQLLSASYRRQVDIDFGPEWQIDLAIVSNGGQLREVDRMVSGGLGAVVRALNLSASFSTFSEIPDPDPDREEPDFWSGPPSPPVVMLDPGNWQRSHTRLGELVLKDEEKSKDDYLDKSAAQRALFLAGSDGDLAGLSALPGPQYHAREKYGAFKRAIAGSELSADIGNIILQTDQTNLKETKSPEWDSTLETLAVWLAEGNCRNETWAENFPDVVGNCEALTFGVAIASDFERSMEAFGSTSTLDDQLTEAAADSIFRLGQYLVLLQWGEIEKNLNRAVSRRNSKAKADLDSTGRLSDHN